MPELLSAQEAHKYPLLRDFDFNGFVYVPEKTNLLTPENKDFYEKVNMPKGAILLIPILQQRFNDNNGISVREIGEEIVKNSDLEKFLGGVNGRIPPIHYYFLQMFEEEGIAWCKTDVTRKRPVFFDDDYFVKGALYDSTRVIIP